MTQYDCKRLILRAA